MIMEKNPFGTYMPVRVTSHTDETHSRHCNRSFHARALICKGVVVCLAITVIYLSIEMTSPNLQVGWRLGHDRVFDMDPYMQQSRTQVTVTVAEIERVQRRRGRCNLLVFGVGFDTEFWMRMNVHGLTVFLEDNAMWMYYTQNRVPNATIFPVSYTTELGVDDEGYLETSSWSSLRMGLPSIVSETEWDIVIVDGPAGYKNGDPGRIQSLYTAATLYRPFDALTVIDDCERWVERTYADLFLGAHRLFLTVSRPVRFVWSRYNPVYGGNQQCFYRGVGLEE